MDCTRPGFMEVAPPPLRARGDPALAPLCDWRHDVPYKTDDRSPTNSSNKKEALGHKKANGRAMEIDSRHLKTGFSVVKTALFEFVRCRL
ncbi:unnamed protein product [Pieris brassicae]|uniref:Uncharacterized protein n=1 Tax=Pieris brassicae TaxID=7116 RepID=A0A9P0TYV6_PIEBR|nr:unnamed protein product [Pieris brassicae]